MSNNTNELRLVPDEVKSLVNAGVFSLYRLADQVAAKFVLITDKREFFLISEEGKILNQVASLDGLVLSEAKKFPELIGTSSNSTLKVNYAS